MNLDSLNRLVLVVIGLFAVVVYLGIVLSGFAKLVSRIRGSRGNRTRTQSAGRRLRNPRSSG